MPIARVPYPNALPTVQNDYVLQNNLLITNFYRVNEPSSISGANVTKGAVFQIGGVIYYCSADTAIGGAASNYVKIAPDVGGATCTAMYVANLAGVAWNQAYNGYYDVTGNLYVFDEGRALQAGAIAVVVQRYLRQDRTGDAYVGRDAVVGRDVTAVRDLNARDVLPTRKIDCYAAGAGAADVLIKNYVNPGPGPANSAAFNIKKPIVALLVTSGAAGGGGSAIEVQSSIGWKSVGFVVSGASGSTAGQLNPGTYRITTAGVSTDNLYALGVYGDVAITAADILV